MAQKKSQATAKTKKSKKTSARLTKKSDKSKTKGKKPKSTESADDAGIVVIDEDVVVDKNAELEARQAYLEEARSQEAFD